MYTDRGIIWRSFTIAPRERVLNDPHRGLSSSRRICRLVDLNELKAVLAEVCSLWVLLSTGNTLNRNVEGKGMYTWYSAYSWNTTSEALRYDKCSQWISVLPARSHVHPQSEWAIPTFAFSAIWYSFTDPGGMEGWVGLGGWLRYMWGCYVRNSEMPFFSS